MTDPRSRVSKLSSRPSSPRKASSRKRSRELKVSLKLRGGGKRLGLRGLLRTPRKQPANLRRERMKNYDK
jgi:hypothetical protein